jgi:uncharacterized RDD family membrane protein YckC
MVTSGAAAAENYPGRRLGLPREGPGSVAGIGRRLLGLVVDWAACLLIVSAIAGTGTWYPEGNAWLSAAPLLVLFVEHTVLVGLLGTTLGHRVAGVRVVGPDGSPIGPSRAAIRSLLLCLAVPPLLMDADLRGVHDKVSRAVVVRG